MPHYYFHVSNGTGEARDEEGTDLPDLACARAKALTGIRSILREELNRGIIDFGGMIRITDERGSVLLEVPFASAVEIRHGDRPG